MMFTLDNKPPHHASCCSLYLIGCDNENKTYMYHALGLHNQEAGSVLRGLLNVFDQCNKLT